MLYLKIETYYLKTTSSNNILRKRSYINTHHQHPPTVSLNQYKKHKVMIIFSFFNYIQSSDTIEMELNYNETK